MKNLTISILALAAVASMAFRPVSGEKKGALIQFETVSVELGKIPQGKPVDMTYEFTNTGDEPLIIAEVKVGCGCTASDYSREPIAKGKKGFVKLTYNASAMGVFNKSATVRTNAKNNPDIILSFHGEVTN